MIATEAGAKGLNLQFCNVVLNYDLPWNPHPLRLPEEQAVAPSDAHSRAAIRTPGVISSVLAKVAIESWPR
ncbi:MAG: hypothetical protein HYU41_17920 [Candidatus Rokubacteria bacterium]|nr:hypothetical protein [Candidatus Rokubacteria bacterium]